MKTGIGKTHIGNVRQKNQDTIFIENNKIGCLDNLFIVADGMGGHRAGEVASSMAVESFCSFLRQTTIKEGQELEDYLREGVLFTNSKVLALSRENEEWGGMGTTFSACSFKGDLMCFAHVGDSRIYLVSQSGIKQISLDHSYVAEMARSGKITEDEARIHPKKNVLTRALGTGAALEADAGRCRVIAGDRVLICSDGLTNMIEDGAILEIMNKEPSPEASAEALTETALKNGGTDNISLVIIQEQ